MKKVLTILTILGAVGTASATHLFRNNASNINTGTLDPNRLPPGLTYLSVYNQTSFIGNANTINCSGSLTCAQSGTTTTITGAAASGGGASSGTPRFPDGVVVGPLNATLVDAYVTSLEQFNLILDTFLATGLTYATTGQGTIYFRNGIYNITGATIPAGINIVCASSVNFILSNTAKTMITNYGTIGDARGSPCNIDAGGQAFLSQVYVPKSYSINNVNFVGGQNQNNVTGRVYPAKYAFCNVQGSSWVTGSMWFKEFNTPGMNAAANLSSLATMTIDQSENCKFKIRTSSYVPGVNAGQGRLFLAISGSTNTDIEANWESTTSGWLQIVRNSIYTHIWGYAGVRSEGASAVNGDVTAFALNNYVEGIGNSTGTVFGPMRVRAFGNGATQIFRVGANGATDKNPFNSVFRDLDISCETSGNTYTGVYVGADSINATLINPVVTGCGTGVSNNGVNTKGTSYLQGTQTVY